MIYLKHLGILSCGTVRANRLQGCPLLTNKELKKKEGGSFHFKSDLNSGVILAKWMDNNAVHLASNYVGVQPVAHVKRWSGEVKRKIEINCPQMVLLYNKGMGGVDLADMLIAIYRIQDPMQDQKMVLEDFMAHG